jgi:predicted permease
MRKLRALWMQLLSMLFRGGKEQDFTAELEAHIALCIDDGLRAGLTESEARRQAIIRLGGAEQVRQAHRERRVLLWLENLAQDLRYSLRTFRRSPGFTVTAVLTLGLGIGACTAIFSLVNAVLIRSLPYGNPQKLVYFFAPAPHIKAVPAEALFPGYADLIDIRQQNRSFQNITAYEQTMFNLAEQGIVTHVGAAKVDENFFATLQSSPEIGRAIGAEDNQPGRDKVAVISHSLWTSLFAGHVDVLQHSLFREGVSYRIIGVMPPAFEYPFRTDLPYGDSHIKSTQIWIPLALTPKQKAHRTIDDNIVVARSRQGVPLKRAQAEMTAIMAGLAALHNAERGEPERDLGALVEPFLSTSLGPVRPLMNLLLGAVCLVLLIACGNAGNLLLARAAGRARELGVRAALGAGRGRMIRQLLTESLLIGLGGGAVGIALAFLFLQRLPKLDPGNIPRLSEASLDARVLAVALAVSLLTSVFTGVLPALSASSMQLTDFLKTHGTRGHARGHSRLQSSLIVLQTAMVVVLMASAGLLIRSYINIESVDTGFSRSTITMNIALDARYHDPLQSRAFFKNLIPKIGSKPGVSAAGAVSNLPLSNSESLGFFRVEGYPNQKDQMLESRSVTPRYFQAMNIPLLAGRFFTEEDDSDSLRPVIVNERFAKTYFPSRNSIGGHISTDENQNPPHWNTIIGVVADVRHTSLEAEPEPQAYSPNYDFDHASIAVRSELPSQAVVSSIRATLKNIDPTLVLTDIQTMGDLMSQASARRRFQTSLLSTFAGIALILALVGLYGLMAYSVSRRTREVGIRMALGAQRRSILFLVLRGAAALIGIGLVVGLGSTWVATRLLRSFLFGVNEHDPLTVGLVCALLLGCGLMAALFPAYRAASVDPTQALRTE